VSPRVQCEPMSRRIHAIAASLEDSRWIAKQAAMPGAAFLSSMVITRAAFIGRVRQSSGRIGAVTVDPFLLRCMSPDLARG
jgi:hypothetical protein